MAIALLFAPKVATFNMEANLFGKEKSIPLLFDPTVAIFKLHQLMGESKGYSLTF